jgi:hypothetical protein
MNLITTLGKLAWLRHQGGRGVLIDLAVEGRPGGWFIVAICSGPICQSGNGPASCTHSALSLEQMGGVSTHKALRI